MKFFFGNFLNFRGSFWQHFGNLLVVFWRSWAAPERDLASGRSLIPPGPPRDASGAPLGRLLRASWGCLGDVLGSLGASLGSSWAVSGRLGSVLGLIFYQNGTKLRHSILNGIVYSILNRFFIELGCPGASKIIKYILRK